MASPSFLFSLKGNEKRQYFFLFNSSEWYLMEKCVLKITVDFYFFLLQHCHPSPNTLGNK